MEDVSSLEYCRVSKSFHLERIFVNFRSANLIFLFCMSVLEWEAFLHIARVMQTFLRTDRISAVTGEGGHLTCISLEI